jgi:hypothetical protein
VESVGIPTMKKAFDCVEMKNRLQAEQQEQEQRLGAEEIRRRRQHWLAKGEDGLARWWRALSKQAQLEHKPHVLYEEETPYRTTPTK